MPAGASIARNALALGLSGGLTLTRDVGAGEVLCEDDAALDNADDAVQVRRAMTTAFAS
jgi:predicted homoserine dehydrogenase-like protein